VSKYFTGAKPSAHYGKRGSSANDVVDGDTQLDSLRKKKQDLEAQQQLADVLLRSMIQQLQMDVTL